MFSLLDTCLRYFLAFDLVYKLCYNQSCIQLHFRSIFKSLEVHISSLESSLSYTYTFSQLLVFDISCVLILLKLCSNLFLNRSIFKLLFVVHFRSFRLKNQFPKDMQPILINMHFYFGFQMNFDFETHKINSYFHIKGVIPCFRELVHEHMRLRKYG